jgi:hypothetical protein
MLDSIAMFLIIIVGIQVSRLLNLLFTNPTEISVSGDLFLDEGVILLFNNEGLKFFVLE